MILFISAGQEVTRKSNTSINKRNLYLNYGLLSIATHFSNKGYPSLQIHGHFHEPKDFFYHYEGLGYFSNDYPIFISIPSFYALSWTRNILKLIRERYRNKKIIIGGRWLIDGEIDNLIDQIGPIDYIGDGLGENHFEFIENNFLKNFKKDKFISFKKLNYELLENRNLYQPSIEVSRGCGMGCSFCQEKSLPLEKLISPELLCNQVEDTLISDSLTKMTPYFEASMFIPSKTWSEDLANIVGERGLREKLEWRTESRVDSINPQILPILRDAGLRIIDLGLESASEIQLQRMSKTSNPKKYLERASVILREAKRNNIKVKINILLYAGECMSTIQETKDWLHAHKECIFGVSVGPVVVYGWKNKITPYLEELKSIGATPCEKNSIIGVQQINLSSSIDHEAARYLSHQISREFMTAENFFNLKKFSYFPRNYSFNDFLADLKYESPENLSFSL